jgi:LysR family transcriptional regulator, hca operon transcriptional activator
LNNLPFITVTDEVGPVLHRVIRDFISEQGIRPSQTYEAENLSMVFSLIASIGGISLLPEYAFRLCPPTVAAVWLALEPPMIDLALAYHPDNRSDVLRTFVRHCERLTTAASQHRATLVEPADS